MAHPKIDLGFPRLEVVFGCMFSGKTEELLSRLRLYAHAKANVILLRPERDTRSNETHAGREFEGTYVPIKTSIETLSKIIGKEKLGKIKVIGFDEGNFFDEITFVKLCRELVKSGKIVIVAGLNLTFAEEGYGPMPRLIELADVSDQKHAICTVCGSPYGTRTRRYIDGHPAKKNSSRDIVGDDKERKTNKGSILTYTALCWKCYREGK